MEFVNYDFLMGFIIGIGIAYAAGLVVYLFMEKKNDGVNGFARATAVKLVLSGLFCVVGLVSYYLLLHYSHSSNIYFNMQLLILLGLFAALIGDFFLQYIKKDVKKYKAGVACFLIAQLLFIVSMTVLNMLDGEGWLIALILTVAVLVCVKILMKRQNWQLGKEKRIVTAYTVVLTFMMARSVGVFVHDMTIGTMLMMMGAVLFLVSDLLLGIWNYNTGKRLHANLNWITYFSGMLLIALSINPAFSTSLLYG